MFREVNLKETKTLLSLVRRSPISHELFNKFLEYNPNKKIIERTTVCFNKSPSY